MVTFHHSVPQTTRSKAPTSISAVASQRSITQKLEKSGISDPAAEKAGAAYVWAQHKKGNHLNHATIAIVDFTQPSTAKRLYVVNLKTGTLTGQYYVAHAKNSGGLYARHFSNRVNTLESSLGVYTIGGTYYGDHGRSKHMIGLEPGINNNAARRWVELHRANYVLPSFIKRRHMAGRTWGCFGLNPLNADKIMNQLPTNTVLFAYADQENSDHTFA